MAAGGGCPRRRLLERWAGGAWQLERLAAADAALLAARNRRGGRWNQSKPRAAWGPSFAGLGATNRTEPLPHEELPATAGVQHAC